MTRQGCETPMVHHRGTPARKSSGALALSPKFRCETKCDTFASFQQHIDPSPGQVLQPIIEAADPTRTPRIRPGRRQRDDCTVLEASPEVDWTCLAKRDLRLC